MTLYPGQIDGYATLPLLVDLVSPVRANDVNRLRNAVVAVETELGINPSGSYGSLRARLDALAAFGAGSGAGSSNGSAGTGEDYLAGMIETPTEKEYTLTSDIPYDGYIHSVSTICLSGSCTLTTRINGTAIGATANAVSTSESTEIATSANSFVSGDRISIQVSANATSADLTFTILMFITPGGEFGEANDGANVGVSGIGPYSGKSVRTLQFRNINVASNKLSISLDVPSKEIQLDVVEANLTLDNIGGTLAINKGGTGNVTASAAFNALAPTSAKGDLVISTGATNTALAVSATDGYLLASNSGESAGVKWTDIKHTVYAYKTVEQSLSSSDVLQNDNELYVALEANAVYFFEIEVFADVGSGAGVRVALDGGLSVNILKGNVTIFSDTALVEVGRITALNTAVVHGPGGAGDHQIKIRGTINTTSAGNFTFAWAQGSSTANPVIIQAGSVIMATRIL